MRRTFMMIALASVFGVGGVLVLRLAPPSDVIRTASGSHAIENIERLDQLLSGSFRLVVRQTFPGVSNRDQIRNAQAGQTTHPADGEVSLWVTTDQRGNILALRSRTVTLPERQLWSETRFVRRFSGNVLLRHHAACRDEALTLPPPSIRDLLLDFGGPLQPFADMGFTQTANLFRSPRLRDCRRRHRARALTRRLPFGANLSSRRQGSRSDDLGTVSVHHR
jgi:hypothetical protein